MGARSLHRVPSHTDVLPSSLRKRQKRHIHSGWQRKRLQRTRVTLTPIPQSQDWPLGCMGPTPSLWQTAPGASVGKPAMLSAMIHTCGRQARHSRSHPTYLHVSAPMSPT